MISRQQLVTLVGEIKPQLLNGTVSTYLPQLAEAKVEDLGVSVELGSGDVISVGEDTITFTMQSVVKLFTLLLAIHDRGEDYVFDRVGRNQSIDAFNSVGLPANPFVNSGALTIVEMLDGGDAQEKVARVLALIRRLSGNPTIDVNLDVAHAELAHSDRNRAICYFLRSCGLVTSAVEDLLWAYCQMCAIEVNVADLARAGSYLARDTLITSVGDLPSAADVRGVRRLLLSTGMYSGSGWYSCKVGLPAKSGISGAMLGIVPGIGGIGVYGPALDGDSNSIGGIRVMESLSTALSLN